MKAYHSNNANVPLAALKAARVMEEQNQMLKNLRAKVTLADIKDDPKSQRFAVSRIDASRLSLVNFATPNPRQKFFNLQGLFVDPTNIQAVPGKGSTPASLSGAFSYTSTTTSITWSWTGLVIYRADGSTTVIPNGNQTFSGLVANTSYWFYPYWSETSQTVNFAGGANTSQLLTQSQTMNLQYNVPLSAGSMNVTTPVSGTGGGSKGGSGNGCLHPYMSLYIRRNGKEVGVFAGEIVVGDEVRAEDDSWQPVLEVTHERCGDWVSVMADRVEDLQPTLHGVVTLTQPFYRDDGTVVRASELTLGQKLRVRGGVAEVCGLNLRRRQYADKVIIQIPPPHLFYADAGGFLMHNGNPKP